MYDINYNYYAQYVCLQEIVHDVYRQIIDDDESEVEWDFSFK